MLHSLPIARYTTGLFSWNKCYKYHSQAETQEAQDAKSFVPIRVQAQLHWLSPALPIWSDLKFSEYSFVHILRGSQSLTWTHCLSTLFNWSYRGMTKALLLPGLVKAGNGLNIQHIFRKSYHSYHITLYWTLQHNENRLQLFLDFIADWNSGIHHIYSSLNGLFTKKWWCWIMPDVCKGTFACKQNCVCPTNTYSTGSRCTYAMHIKPISDIRWLPLIYIS